VNGGAGEEDAEASAGRNQIGDGWGTGGGGRGCRAEGQPGKCGGFPLPESVSRAAGPLDGDPRALAGLIAQISVTDSQCAVFIR
jgi:hypothetical protein